MAGQVTLTPRHLNRVAYDGLTALDAARRSGAEEMAAWLSSQGAGPAGEME